MTLEQTRKHFGSIVAVTNALGITRQCWATWVKHGHIPLRRQAQLAKITKGKLKYSLKDTNYKNWSGKD